MHIKLQIELKKKNQKKLDDKRDWIITIHMDPYDDLEIDKE